MCFMLVFKHVILWTSLEVRPNNETQSDVRLEGFYQQTEIKCSLNSKEENYDNFIFMNNTDRRI